MRELLSLELHVCWSRHSRSREKQVRQVMSRHQGRQLPCDRAVRAELLMWFLQGLIERKRTNRRRRHIIHRKSQ